MAVVPLHHIRRTLEYAAEFHHATVRSSPEPKHSSQVMAATLRASSGTGPEAAKRAVFTSMAISPDPLQRRHSSTSHIAVVP
jgi:hypothetical protein